MILMRLSSLSPTTETALISAPSVANLPMLSATTSSAARGPSFTRGIRRWWTPSPTTFEQPVSEWPTKWGWSVGSAQLIFFLERWYEVRAAAVDVTVSHPLAPSLGLCAQAARSILKIKESSKILKYRYRHIFVGNALGFVPLALTTFDGIAPEANTFLDKAAEVHPSIITSRRRAVVANFYKTSKSTF